MSKYHITCSTIAKKKPMPSSKNQKVNSSICINNSYKCCKFIIINLYIYIDYLLVQVLGVYRHRWCSIKGLKDSLLKNMTY